MAETHDLTDHDAIRQWAAARQGRPAMNTIPTGGTGPDREVLHLVFGQHTLMESDDDTATESLRLVDWDEWFAVFEREKLALNVLNERAGVVDETHSIVARQD